MQTEQPSAAMTWPLPSRPGICGGFLLWALCLGVGLQLQAQGTGEASLPTTQPAQGAAPERYDPDKNLDTDGTTVLKPELPADVPNPERWRYIPEGRIKPGNPFQRFLATSFVSPLFFRQEDVGFGGGVAVTDIDFRNQRFREFANIVASYTEEGQQAFRFNWLRWLHHREIPEGGIIRDERSRYGFGINYSRTLTRRFFGLEGNATPPAAGGAAIESDAETETSYTEELFSAGWGIQWSAPDPGDDLRFSLGVSFQNHQLQGGEVTGVPSTNDPQLRGGIPGFAELFAQGDEVSQLWLNGGIAYDTRDSVSNPYSGYRVGFGINAAAAQSGLAPGAVFVTDVGAAWAVPGLFHDGGRTTDQNPPTDVLAIGGFLSTTAGDLPFYSLPSLGGDGTLRGFIQNRFTARTVAHGSLEYRVVIVPRGIRFTDTIRLERISMAAFYDFGWAADNVGDLGSRFLDSIGAGIRLGLTRDATFRIDLGLDTEGGSNLTIAFGNSF